jgi:flagellar L-ring protein FlgH
VSMRPALLAAALLLPALAGCDSVREAVDGPKMGPMGYPAVLVGVNQPVLESSREPLPQPATANSLWRTGARAFFNDQRAGRVGDILTVLVTVNDSAKTQNTTNTGITSSNAMGVPNFLGLESTLGKVLPGAFDPSKMITTNTANASQGTGGINRTEQISLTIAAVVTQVLPNGNLVIEGKQEIRVNYEIRQLIVAGIVRPEDIQSDNTIDSSKIAQARISYGGRGQISDFQQPRYGQQLSDILLPF